MICENSKEKPKELTCRDCREFEFSDRTHPIINLKKGYCKDVTIITPEKYVRYQEGKAKKFMTVWGYTIAGGCPHFKPRISIAEFPGVIA